MTRMHSSRMCTVRCSGRLRGGRVSAGDVSARGVYNPLVNRCKNITFPQLRLRTVWHKLRLREPLNPHKVGSTVQ